MSTRCRLNATSCQHDAVSKRCRAKSMSCQDDVVSRRRRVKAVSGQDDAVPRRRLHDATTCQGGVVPKKNTPHRNNVVSMRHSCKHDIVSTLHRVNTLLYIKQCRVNMVPCQDGVMARRCRAINSVLSTLQCVKKAPCHNGVVSK